MAVQWDLGGHRDLYLLLGRECQATCLVKVLGTWSWQGKKRDRGLKQRGAGGEVEEETLRETEAGGGRMTGELLMTGTGGIAETFQEGEMLVVGGIITGEKGNGRKMMGGEAKEEEGERKGEEVKVQEEVGRGAGREKELMTGVLILLLEVNTCHWKWLFNLYCLGPVS